MINAIISSTAYKPKIDGDLEPPVDPARGSHYYEPEAHHIDDDDS